jgi:tetratricopeptide (TPR) repeat protein
MLLRRLAVFSGSFGLDAVEAVCAGDGLDARDVADLLARLVEKSLVALDGQPSHGRYRQLESIRLYAQARLAEAGEAEALVERHARWALALAESGAAPDVLDADAANLRAALDALVARAPDDALRLCVALRPFWLRRIELAEAERHFAAALEASGDRGALRADALLSAAALDWRGGALSRARERAEESLELAAEVGDARRRWNALQFLGEFGATYTTDAAAVDAVLEQAIELARAEQLAAEEALGLYALGVARWLTGEPGGEDLIARSLELLAALPDRDAQVRAPLNVAEIRGDRPAVAIVLEETLQPHLEVTRAAATAFVQANLAAVARARGDFGRAAELLDESARRFEQLRDPTGRAYVLARRGHLALARGDTAEAARSLGAASDLRRELGDRRGAGLAQTGLAMVATAEGDHDAAEAQLAEARELFHRAGDRWGLVNALWRTADLGLARGDPDAAEAALREARAVLDEPQLERWIAHTDVGLAEVALARGEPGTAVALLTDAAARYAAASDPAGAAAARERLEAVRAQR